MIISITGHRPPAVGGYKLPNPIYNKVCKELEKVFIELNPDKIIVGGSLGVDQWAAMIAYKLKIYTILAIPFEGQEKMWPEESQKTYRLLRKLASEEVIVSPGGYSADKMQVRNCWMVDHSDKLIAIWNGDTIKSGTFKCINYAKSVNKDIFYIDPRLDR